MQIIILIALFFLLTCTVQVHSYSLRRRKTTDETATPEAPEATHAAFKLLKASRLLDHAVAQFKAGGPDAVEQPPCVNVPSGFYFFCITLEKELGDTTWVVHPIIAPGTTLAEISPRNPRAAPGVETLKDAIASCPTVEDPVLGTYLWDNAGTGENFVYKTALVIDFYAPFVNGYFMCGIEVAETPAPAKVV